MRREGYESDEIIAIDTHNLLKYVHRTTTDKFIQNVQFIFIIINYNCFVPLYRYFYSEEISKPVRYRCAGSGIDRNVMVHFYFALFLFVRYLFAFSVLYYSNFTYVWETRIFDEAGSRWCLKKCSSRELVIPFGIKVDGYLQLKFPRFHKSTANKFELHRGLREEMIPQLLPLFFPNIVYYYEKDIRRIIIEK